MSGMLQANVRQRCEIMVTTALLRRASNYSSQPTTMSVLSFCAEYVAPNSRFPTIHTRHQPLLEPGQPAPRLPRVG